MTERCGGGCVRPIGHDGGCRDSWHAYERCGSWMPLAGESCARRAGHSWDHRTSASLIDKAVSRAHARARARYNDADEYSVAIAHNAQRPGPRLYSESRGVDVHWSTAGE